MCALEEVDVVIKVDHLPLVSTNRVTAGSFVGKRCLATEDLVVTRGEDLSVTCVVSVLLDRTYLLRA